MGCVKPSETIIHDCCVDLASRVAQSTFGDRAQTTRSRLSGIEHHIFVLLIGAAPGSNATIQEMSRNDAKTRAACTTLSKLPLRPQQSQPSQKLVAEPATAAVQPAAPRPLR